MSAGSFAAVTLQSENPSALARARSFDFNGLDESEIKIGVGRRRRHGGQAVAQQDPE